MLDQHRPMRIDHHQHLWTERVCAALARRTSPPLVRAGEAGWVLELAHEPPFALGQPEPPEERVAALERLGADAAVVALSAALGVETLPDREARDILAAWDADADELPDRLSAWGSIALADPRPADVDAALARGRIGITLPATALSDPARLDHVEPVLERLAAHGAPLFVHPGPAGPGDWLPAMTSYLASLAAAWMAWALHGRRRHPRLPVVFAALGALAPLHAERLEARVGPDAARRALEDPLTSYDTSSYGPAAVEAMRSAVGEGRLVHGSDWPYAAPAVAA